MKNWDNLTGWQKFFYCQFRIDITQKNWVMIEFKKLLKAIAFIFLVFLMVALLKLAVLMLFKGSGTVLLWVISALAAFGIWNIPRLFRA